MPARFLTPLEIARMFSAARGARDSIALKCLYYLGLRSSEARGLRVEDIDNAKRAVSVYRGKHERRVPVPGEFADELRAFTDGRSGHIFDGRGADGALSGRHLRRIVKNCAMLADLERHEEIRPHTLRHSYASHLRESGVPLPIIQELLGHAKTGTTAAYAGIKQERASEYIERAFRTRYGTS